MPFQILLELWRFAVNSKRGAGNRPIKMSNICSYCGRAHEDDVRHCTGCGTELPSAGLAQAADATTVIAIPPQIPASSPAIPIQRAFLKTQIFEVGLVLYVAFIGPIFTSLYSLFQGKLIDSGMSANARWTYGMLQEAGALGVLAYVLSRSSRYFSNLGLRWAWKDAGWSLLLAIAGYASFYICYIGIAWGVYATSGQPLHPPDVGRYFFHGGVGLIAILFALLNGFYEELIARAYLITEIKRVAGNPLLAIGASVALQTTYHFYQGIPLALSHMSAFLIFSIYYSATGRAWPVILAHILTDLFSMVGYSIHNNS
jgi:membrane protease YdiL (CAAX protease family)